MWSWKKKSRGLRFGKGIIVVEPILAFWHFRVQEVEEAMILELRVSNSQFTKSLKIQGRRIKEDISHRSRGR
jgi:hypothetical protein